MPFVDTGNQLVDPISKEPVMVIEHKKMVNISATGINKMLDNKNLPPLDKLINTLLGPQWLHV